MTELKHWETLERRLVLDRPPWMQVYEDDLALPDGRTVNGYLRIETPGYAMVMAVDDAGRVGLVRSYKRGVDAVDMQPPAGVLDAGEDPLACAQRELLEELGCSAAGYHEMGSYVMNGNYFLGRAHMFLATGCKPVVTPDPGDLEEQQIVWMPYQEVRSLWLAGSFQQLGASAIIGLGLAHLERLVESADLSFGERL